MEYYLANATLCGLGIFLDLIVLASLKNYNKKIFTEDRVLHIFIVANAFICGSDFVAALLRYHPSPNYYWIVYFNYVINYSALALTAYLWLAYSLLRVWPKKKLHKRALILGAIPMMAVFFMAITSYFTDWIITINQEGLYVRGPFYYIPWIIDPLYIIMGFLLTLIAKSDSSRYRFFPFKIMFLTVSFGAIFQNLTGNLCTIGVSISLALVELTLALKDEQAFIDPLTGVYNRQYMLKTFRANEHIQKKNKIFAGISFDLDDFKYINDNFGHLAGDSALQTFGKILREAVNLTDGIPFRIGGDEFMILTYASSEEEVDRLIEEVQNLVDTQNKTSKNKFTLKFSAGAAIFYPNQNDNIDSLMARMDEEMYRVKEEHHKQNN
ncbi:MAG: diguanylate cyclase [Eubacterium sp.]|nr:diguanylate cyclase [Eubacterium sp.]